MSTITMASHGQPSRKQPSGPLLMHFLHPMHRMGSTWMRPNGGWSSSGTQNMQSATGQYSTHAGEPAQPVQHSVITASSLGFFLRGVVSPVDLGSNFISSGTIPAALFPVVSAGIGFLDYTSKPIRTLSLRWDFRTVIRHISHVQIPQFPPGAFCYSDPPKESGLMAKSVNKVILVGNLGKD